MLPKDYDDDDECNKYQSRFNREQYGTVVGSES